MKKSILIPTVLLSTAVFFLLSFSEKEAAIDLSHYKISEKAYLYHVPTKKESQQVSLLSSTSFFNIFLGKTFIGFKEALGFNESTGNYASINRYGYLGKYQFAATTLSLIGVYNTHAFLANAALQEKAFIANTS
ncbi:peptidoglycan-binding protein LysM, partial [Flavobacteriaceae bacterium]|nr:peptidoglycan-binding protein LysM [Flavobacteriaceae bacterium]